MRLEEFAEAFSRTSAEDIDWGLALEHIGRLARIHSIETDVPPDQIQLVVALEELSELSCQIAKCIRKRGNRMAVLEELADARITCKYVQSSLGFSDDEVDRAVRVKLDRYSADGTGESA